MTVGKILVAEDNAVNQKLITMMLKELGLAADVANDGREAVQRFVAERYSLIIMDVSMPILDGLGATEQILELEKRQNLTHTPIIALTAHAIKGDREKFINAGMDDYLSKPIDMESLRGVVSKFLDG